MRLTTCLALLIAAPCMADSPYTGTTTAFIPYANAAGNPNLDASPTINLGFNGSGHHVPFIMDTGSVGIVASPDIFTPDRGAKYMGPGQQIYSSSGIIEEGTWWSATQEIYDTNGNLIATANVPVLQVTSIKCTHDARSCTTNNNPKGIAVMGIGFARESPEQVHGTPNYNAFLNLQTIIQNGVLQKLPKDWCNGYVVTPTGVFLGLTAANTANAGFVKLMPWPQYSTPTLPEWMPAPMTVKVNNVSGNGNVLMDTGVAAGFLTPPPNSIIGPLVTCPGTTLVECVPNGNQISTYLPNETNPVAFYTFTVGQVGNAMQPSGVHVVPGTDIFFNTSRHVLGGINFLYDNTNGYIGYIWNGQSSGSVGFVNPATAPSTTILTSSNNPALVGQNVTFIITVIGAGPTPTGSVVLLIDNNPEYPTLNSNGVAAFSTSQLIKGAHSIVAKYSGDSTYIRSSSAPLIEHISSPNFTNPR